MEGPRVTDLDIHILHRDELEVVSRALANRSSVVHRERLMRQEQGVFTYLIAWEDGEPVGHVGIDWPDDRRPEFGMEWSYLPVVHDLDVRPERRNRGIGRALMLVLERHVRNHGLPTIGLSTGLHDGYAPARHLYRSLGYAEIPRTTFIESSRRPSDPPAHTYLEVLTNWRKSLSP